MKKFGELHNDRFEKIMAKDVDIKERIQGVFEDMMTAKIVGQETSWDERYKIITLGRLPLFSFCKFIKTNIWSNFKAGHAIIIVL